MAIENEEKTRKKKVKSQKILCSKLGRHPVSDISIFFLFGNVLLETSRTD